MSGSYCASNLTSGFIDLATYDELEKYMYGGQDATSYFVRQTRRATWFTQVPVVLSRASGSPDFGNDWSVTISRAGDYLLHTWLRVTIPALTAAAPPTGAAAITEQIGGAQYTLYQKYISWTPNLMHNLVRECCITFNDLVAARFDNYHLDFWSAFTTPAGKQLGYSTMIGNVPELIDPSISLPKKVLNLPLPFFYTRDSGVALPTAALPYNDMRIFFSFRQLTELLNVWYVYTTNPASPTQLFIKPAQPVNPAVDLVQTSSNYSLSSSAQVWANYAIVSNDERKRMACAPRDILIEQVQTAPWQTFNPLGTTNYDIRFSHAIKALFFAVQNTTIPSYWSNYTTREPQVCQNAGGSTNLVLDNYFPGADPIDNTTLIYENTQRLANMGSDYFSYVEPYYAAPVIPTFTGYHVYSYSLDFICLDPLGSTNYGKLTNVSIIPIASADAKCVSTPYSATNPTCADNNDWYPRPQTFRFIVTAVNNNIIRISGGALGFPVL